jgi:hypothetical protein
MNMEISKKLQKSTNKHAPDVYRSPKLKIVKMESKKQSFEYSEMVVLADIIIDSFLELRRKEKQKASA